jgi:hypothetical protein
MNVATGYDLMRLYPTNDGDHAWWHDCYCKVKMSVLTALSCTGRLRYGRRMLLLTSLRTHSFLLAVTITGDVTAG